VDVTIAGGGDRKGYQQDWRNAREALEEVRLDLAEGADMVMVKPALAYLDVIAAVRAVVDVPARGLPRVRRVLDDQGRRGANGWIDGDPPWPWSTSPP
jgi:porphobilinogen synthase